MRYFRKIGALDPAPVVAALAAIPHAFADGTWRHKLPRTPHIDSETLEIYGPPSHRPRDVLGSYDCMPTEHAEVPAFRKAIDDIAALAQGKPARAMIVSLRPGGTVRLHKDEGAYAVSTERYHFALETNASTLLVAEEESAFMRAGEVWWIDKHVGHAAANLGGTPRIHFILDLWRTAA